MTFPQGTDHLKYFEKNPHPDRIPDELLAIAELLPKTDLNVNLLQLKFEFDLVKKYLEPQLSDLDRKILSMPLTLQKMIDTATDEDYIKAYTHLRNCFYTYFSTPLDERVRPDIQWIEFPFATRTTVAQNTPEELKNNLFNSAAMDKLAEKLQEAGAFCNGRKDFYFWNTEPYNWSDISYQSRSINVVSKPFMRKILKSDYIPQYMALGDFTINAIPEGYVQPKGKGRYDICVNKVFYFVNDSFNFDDFEYLGYWDLPQGINYSYLSNAGSTFVLYNSYFRDFQRHGYGRYFPVLSKLHEVENFEPVCREYPFVK